MIHRIEPQPPIQFESVLQVPDAPLQPSSLPIKDREEAVSKPQESADSPSLWTRAVSWVTSWFQASPPASPKENVPPTPSPINRIPTLAPPALTPGPFFHDSSLQRPPLKTRHIRATPPDEAALVELLSRMNLTTADAIMHIVIAADLALQDERILLASESEILLKQLKKVQDQTLIAIQEQLASDQNLQSVFTTAQNVAIGANFVCSAAYFLIQSLGGAAAVSGLLLGVGFPALGAGLLLLQSFVPTIMVGVTVSVGMGTVYSKHQSDKSQGKLAEASHKQTKFDAKVRRERGNLEDIADRRANVQECFVKYLREQHKIKQQLIPRP